MARLSIHLLGPFDASLDRTPVANFETDKVRALLAYVTVEVHRPHRRQELAGLLWPDWPERSARANLRYAIGDRQADPPHLLITRDSIQFNIASDSRVDVAVFDELFKTDQGEENLYWRLKQALALYRGPFLSGFSLKDSAPFEDWALLERERLQRQYLGALGRLAEHYGEHGEYEQACELARQRVEIDPLDEEANWGLMRLLALRGHRAEALVHYEAYRQHLATELDVAPTAETQAMVELLSKGELPAQPVPIRALEREPRVVGRERLPSD